jgi:flavodoxin
LVRPTPAMNRRRTMMLLGAVPVVLGATAFVTMVVKDQSYVPSPVFKPAGKTNSGTAVVYYSRSGHSEAVAREVARMFDAPIARIASDYPLSFAGQGKALADARSGAMPLIEVEPIDLESAERVYMVSPTWLFRPATPLWSYVEQTDLTNKEVVLVTTGNSRFEQTETNEFAKRVEARGGRLVRHVFLRRGRIYWQMSREELLDAVRNSFAAPAMTSIGARRG